MNNTAKAYSFKDFDTLSLPDVLFSIDCLQAPFAAHGYGSFFSMSVMDRYYKPGTLRLYSIPWKLLLEPENKRKYPVYKVPFNGILITDCNVFP